MLHKEHRQNRTERLRGYIIYLIFTARPRPLELSQLMRLLDSRNYPTSQHKLAEELSFLRDAGLLTVNTTGSGNADGAIDWIERYADADRDAEIGDRLRAKLTPAGINFHEGAKQVEGIARVE